MVNNVVSLGDVDWEAEDWSREVKSLMVRLGFILIIIFSTLQFFLFYFNFDLPASNWLTSNKVSALILNLAE